MTEEVKIKSFDILCGCDMDYLKAVLFFTTVEGNWDKDNHWVFMGAVFYSLMVLILNTYKITYF